MKKTLLIFILIISVFTSVKAQAPDCSTATPFCTGTNVTFPASTNTTSPIGPFYDCLTTQPNPAFFQLEIDQPGNLTISMQSTPLVDIDFICWGPFNDPNTMCDSLTAAYVEDCSYSPAAIEVCDIVNAVVGQFYILLITNFSNSNCNIAFSQTSGAGSTNCCILGDAGQDNNFTDCNSAPSFIMENELNGSPASGGIWYDNNWNVVSNSFDPATGNNGTYAYIVQGTPVPGSSVVCPDDTAFLTINISSCFDINLISSEASCLGNDATITCTLDTTLLPSWQCELYDMAGTNLAIASNLTNNSYTFLNLFPGTYAVRALDNFGGWVKDTIVAGQVQTSISIASNPVGVTCYNGDDGQIGVWVSGGLWPYTFYIDGVLSTNAYPYDSLFQNLSVGTYIVSVLDYNNCMIRDTVDIPVPLYPLQALASSKVIVCYGVSNGEVIGSAAGGTPGYSYEWFDSGFTSFSTDSIAFGLSAGSYTLRVEDANGCDTITSVTVIEPTVPLDGSPQVFNVACKGDTTGMIVGDASGSWAPYQYQWFDQNGTLLPQSSLDYIFTRDTLENLGAGIYILTITDIEGCSIDYTFNIDEPALSLSIDSLAVIDDIACYGDSVGRARLYASGGGSIYSYLWDNGETSIIANTLTSGYHTVSLIDDWGCEVVDSIEISETSLIVSNLVVNATISCYGGSDGIASISSSGGVDSIYTYFWSQGQQTVGVNTDIAVGLLHGSYYVTTRDSLGCEVVDSIYISEPEILVMEASELAWIDCYGYDNGEAFAVAQGGTSPYLFDWDNDGIPDGDTVYTLTPGLHTVTVTDARGCTASDTILTHQPSELTITIDDLQTILPYCIGVNTGSLSAVAQGGNLGYTYEWNDNLVQPQTTTTATSLLAGIYTITVTDIKGCTASDTRSIDTITNTMDASIDSLSFLEYAGDYHVSCYGFDDGFAWVNVWGAHAPYSYQWYGPNSFSSTNDTITDLLAGVYSVTIRDTNDCMVNRSINLTEPAPIYFTVLVSGEETCLGSCDGVLSIDSISGGVMPYTGLITDNATGTINALLINTDSIAGYIIDSICSGIYSVNITDANGCPSALIAGGNDQVSITPDAIVTAQIDPNYDSPLCAGDSTAQLNMLLGSFDSLYNYSWINIADPNTILDTLDSIDSVPAGTYVLHAEHANFLGCQASDTLVIIGPDLIQISATITNATCHGDNNGSIDASIIGGTLGVSNTYTFSWSTTDTTEDLSNLIAGSYTLSATDSLDCEESVTFQVTEPQALSCSVTQDQPNGYVLTASVATGGTPSYSYSWREQSSPNNSIGTGTTYVVTNYGTYYALVKDANNCTLETNSFPYEDVTGIGDDLTNLDLNIYPNPFREETTVDFGRDITQATISLVDVFGKQIEKYNITNTSKHIIKRNNKASGIYFVEIQVEQQKTVMFKLIVE